EVVRARKAEGAIGVRSELLIVDRFPECFGETGRHLGAGQELARNADSLANQIVTLENPVRASSNVLGRDPGELLVSHGERQGEAAVRAPLRAHPEVDEV